MLFEGNQAIYLYDSLLYADFFQRWRFVSAVMHLLAGVLLAQLAAVYLCVSALHSLLLSTTLLHPPSYREAKPCGLLIPAYIARKAPTLSVGGFSHMDQGRFSNRRRGTLHYLVAGRVAGKVTVIVVPLPGSLCNAMGASWSFAACLTMERPSPVPPISLEWLLSTR